MRRQKRNQINIKGSCKYFVSISRHKLVRFVVEVHIKDGDGYFKTFFSHLRNFLLEVHYFYFHVDGGNWCVVLTSHHYTSFLCDVQGTAWGFFLSLEGKRNSVTMVIWFALRVMFGL